MDKASDLKRIDFDNYFNSIIAFPFVKNSFHNIVYKKLLIDGYVYCYDGLFPNNKIAFKQLDPKKFPLYGETKEKNPDTYKELYTLFKSNGPDDSYKLSNLEQQLVLYLLFQLDKHRALEKVLTMLDKYYRGKFHYRQYGNFVCTTDIELRSIDSLHKFVEYVSKLSDANNLFYRGHSNINYITIPSLFREKRFYQNEYVMYQELVIRCASSFVNCSSHLDFLMEMQHYGLPTRLLDVTSNPLVALYFACENHNNVGEVIVYNIENSDMKYEKCDEVSILTALPMFNFSVQQSILHDIHAGSLLSSRSYEALISEIKTERPLLSSNITYDKITTPVFVKPARKNSRILRQEGAFIIWGLDDVHYSTGTLTTSFDDRFRYKESSKKIIYYIPQKHKKKIINSLNLVGINKAFVYPEIDDVAAYIKATI